MDKEYFKTWVNDNCAELEAYSILNNSNDMLEFFYKTNKRFYNTLNELIDAYENRDYDYQCYYIESGDLRELYEQYKKSKCKDFKLEINELENGCVTDLLLNGVSVFDWDDFLEEVEKL